MKESAGIRVIHWIKEAKSDRTLPARAVAGLCALFVLCFLPLAYRNFFFDINRYKVELFIRFVPAASLAMVFAAMYARKYDRLRIDCGMRRVFISICCFAAACVCSAALRGFEKPVLDGSEGRYSGLIFLLCCAAMFIVIALGRLAGERIALLAIFSAAAVALLGVLNTHGLDPLGFYRRMQPNQIHLFISTIGNVDFYGGYLVTLFPLAGGFYVLSDKRHLRVAGLICALVILLGIPAARSDSAYFTMHFALIVLLAFGGGSYASMMRAAVLCACAWGFLPVAGHILISGSWEYRLFGILAWFCDSGVSYLLCVLSAVLAGWFYFLHRRGAAALGIRRTVRVLLALVAVCAFALIMLNVYFTLVEPDVEIGLLSQILRFDDDWGTRRGFVYIRSMRALADYSPLEWAFGKGVDLTKHILNPYLDRPDITRLGVFNDAHCQPLQFLLTIGLLGSVSFMAFHILLMYQLYQKGAHDALSLSCLCALSAYTLVALVHVAQPILLSAYFAVAALGASRLMYLNKRREPHES